MLVTFAQRSWSSANNPRAAEARALDVGNAAATLADLAVYFDRDEQPENAATIYLGTVLGQSQFDECVTTGAAMELAQAVEPP